MHTENPIAEVVTSADLPACLLASLLIRSQERANGPGDPTSSDPTKRVRGDPTSLGFQSK